MGRLPDRGHGRGRRARAAHAQGPGLHEAFRERLEGAREGAEDPGLRRRRRGLRARRGRPAELLRDAAGEGRHADRLLRLRPARGRGRADRRPAPRGAAQAAREAPRQAEPDRSVLGELRRRRRTVRSREPAGARGDPGQAPRLEVPPGQALTGVAEGQRARPAGVRDRRLHARQGQARAHARLARPGDVSGRRARIRRQRRHRLQRPRDRPAAREAEADRARQVCVPAKCRRCRA